MRRVPSVNPDIDRRIAALEEKLSKLRAVPAHTLLSGKTPSNLGGDSSSIAGY